jgi:hypothetical protein
MSNRNCPNCGAPYEINLNKCSFCGTSYYDLSAIDFTSHEPFYLKIKIDMGGVPYYITQLVKPRADMFIEFGSETDDVYDSLGSRIYTYTRRNTMTTNITFDAVTSTDHKNLCTIEIGG